MCFTLTAVDKFGGVGVGWFGWLFGDMKEYKQSYIRIRRYLGESKYIRPLVSPILRNQLQRLPVLR